MKRPGFTLIELMIVVSIVAFLAAISIPQYSRYIAKARQSEVFINLASLHTAQQTYFAQHGKYSTVLWGDGGIGWHPDGYKGGGKQEKFYYTYGFYFSGAQEGVHYFTGKLEAPAEKLNASFANQEKFIAKAAADIIGKSKTDVWYVDEARNITNEQPGID